MAEPSKKKGRLLIRLDSDEEQNTLDNILDNIATKLGTKCTCHLAIRACNIHETLKRTLDLYFFSLQPCMLKLLFVYLFGTIA